MEDKVNSLIGKYGIVAVHEYLDKKLKEDYAYMKKIFEKTEKKVVKEEILVEEAVVENVVEPVVEDKEKKFKDPKEIKAWQKQMEEKKRLENEAKGIIPKELLTKENLQKWIVEENKTFSYIAREYVGCKDSEVSLAAKFYNIESTRKNVMIQGAKKH
jgi:hypothetical protein